MNVTLHIDGKPVTLENVARKAQEISFTLGKKSYRFRADGHVLEKENAGGVLQRVNGFAWQAKNARRVQLGALEADISEAAKTTAHTGETPLSPPAPMPGVIRQILVKVGDKVKQGQPLIVMEAMKLQTTLTAGGNGKVEAVLVKVDQLVTEGAELVKIK